MPWQEQNLEDLLVESCGGKPISLILIAAMDLPTAGLFASLRVTEIPAWSSTTGTGYRRVLQLGSNNKGAREGEKSEAGNGHLDRGRCCMPEFLLFVAPPLLLAPLR